MGSTTRSASVRCLPVIEGLEGRTLLSSAWVGTWSVDLAMAKFELAGANGFMKVESGAPNTAVITETGPGQFHLTADGGKFQMDMTGTDTLLQGGWAGQLNPEGKYSDVVFRMRRFEGNVASVFHSMVEYNAANQRRLTYAEVDGGFAWPAGTSLSLSSFPREGTFTARSTNISASPSSLTAFDSTVGDETQSVTIAAVDGKANTYTVDSGDGDVHEWTLQGNKLVYAYEGVSEGGSAYSHQFDTLVQGPGGRLFYLGGGADFNTMSGFVQDGRTYAVGQMKNAWLGFGYTNVFKAAPVLKTTAPMYLTAIKEDDRTNTGTPISVLIASSGINTITDLNKGAKEGIALTAVNAAYGKWQYTTNGGTTWTNVGAISELSALLLGSDTQNFNRLRLVPAKDYNGTIADAITFRAWDQTAGSNGARVDVSNNGGTRAYSSAFAVASIRVKPVNDAPVLSAPVTIVLTGAALNRNFGISFDTLATAIQAVSSYRDVDNTHDSLGFRITAMSGTLKKSGVSAGSGPVLLMSSEAIAWRPATNAKGRITALQVQIWDGKLASTAFVTVIIRVV